MKGGNWGWIDLSDAAYVLQLQVGRRDFKHKS